MLANTILIAQLAWRNFWRRGRQNTLIISVLSIAMVLTNFIISMPNGIGHQMESTVINNFLGNISIRTKAYDNDQSIMNSFAFDPHQLDSIRQDPRVLGATARVIMPIVVQSERKARNALLIGIDRETEGKASFFLQEFKGDSKVLDEGKIIIGQKLLEKMQSKTGYRLVLSGQDIHGKNQQIGITIGDTFTSSATGAEDFYIIASKETVQTFGDAIGRYSVASITLKNNDDTDIMMPIMEKIAPTGTEVVPWYVMQPFVAAYLDIAVKIMYFFLSFVFIAAVIPLSNSMMMSILDRINEFGIFQALGGKPRHIVFQVIVEGLYILTAGLSIGMVLSIILVGTLQKVGIDMSFIQGIKQFLGFSDRIYPLISLKLFAINGAYLGTVGFIAISIPAIKASMYKPIEAMRKKK